MGPLDWPCSLPPGLSGVRESFAGGAALPSTFWCAAFVALPSPRPVLWGFFSCLVCFFFLFLFFSLSFLGLGFFLPPSSLLLSKKSQRDSWWGVVGYDLRAGGDVRRGSQRGVGRGARGAVPGLGWAGLGVPYGTGCGCRCGCGCGLAVLVGRTGGRAGEWASSFEGPWPWPLLSWTDEAGREVANSSSDGGGGSSSVDRRNGCGRRQPRSMAAVLCQPAVRLQAWSLGLELLHCRHGRVGSSCVCPCVVSASPCV